MQKMGWSHGKGLGANMDGETENIKVVMKADSKGLGFSDKEEDNWIAHQDDFNDILSQLHQEHSDGAPELTTVTPKSIEERSKSSKRRVHYKKFTQGKDLANRSVDDMNCILGKRSGSSTPHSTSAPTSDTEDDNAVTLSHGVRTLVNSISLQDYFAQKMARKQKKNLKVINGDCPEGNSPPDDQVGFDGETAEGSEGVGGDGAGDADRSPRDEKVVGTGRGGEANNSVSIMVDSTSERSTRQNIVNEQGDRDVKLVKKRKKRKRKQRDMQQEAEEGDCLDPRNGQILSQTYKESETGIKPKCKNNVGGGDESGSGLAEGLDTLMGNGAVVEIEEVEILKKKRKKIKKKRRQDC